MLPQGEETLRTVLRDPPSELMRLAEAMLVEQTRLALKPLLHRSHLGDTLRGMQRTPVGASQKEAPEQSAAQQEDSPAPAPVRKEREGTNGYAAQAPAPVMRPAVMVPSVLRPAPSLTGSRRQSSKSPIRGGRWR